MVQPVYDWMLQIALVYPHAGFSPPASTNAAKMSTRTAAGLSGSSDESVTSSCRTFAPERCFGTKVASPFVAWPGTFLKLPAA